MSLSACSLAKIAILHCIPSLDDDRSSSLVAVIIRSLFGDDCGASLLLVVEGRSLVVSRRAVVWLCDCSRRRIIIFRSLVGGVLRSIVASRRWMVIVCRYSDLARRHHSFARSRGLRPFIASCCRRTIVRCLVSCAHRLFVVAWALSLVVRRRLCAVARVSSLVSRCLSSPVLRSFVVARALSLFVRL